MFKKYLSHLKTYDRELSEICRDQLMTAFNDEMCLGGHVVEMSEQALDDFA